ncbi:hypothetical protein A6M27_00290 [Acidithiobacillus thiooxidans]|uniref:Abortive infection protein-like C-terminal domain-containing protein n=1 Tax=Acidithiobacillus thiooxidans TaxID=930 RepID=A0A1C2INC2_ACITH|nr:abortive infection family protein [Acidithiobacillus thiooxidans]OCX77467.1 hypothetical protein A6P07_00015 [Acidithiobacillus thiooxidans]OCX78352.1 hypothetical protein A6O24_04705 [Acidithiobacillus thiooxidans]OCX84726.1 hypothetical protein A6O26_03590 [Acidithiobacillus thiooxidans]OCX89696.1 hypothetical protein A6M27_00290 [Acidithiobacillus thiooxidans]OFC50821.1 hypothetical protein BAE47_01195 [Acidithiobacillus thiooxidans]
MIAPLSESIIAVVCRLVDDAGQSREPSHSDIKSVIGQSNLSHSDPNNTGNQPIGKAKRIRFVLNWALDNNVENGRIFVDKMLALLRGCGGFREGSPNYVGANVIDDCVQVFKHEGFIFFKDGTFSILNLESLSGRELVDALCVYVRRAQSGAEDAALLVGTSKDLVEATSKHVLMEKTGQCPQTNFPALLGMAFVALNMKTSQHPKETDESAWSAMERSAYDLACAANKLRNKEGVGHGRPWLPTITDVQARLAIQSMGLVSELLLEKLEQTKKDGII